MVRFFVALALAVGSLLGAYVLEGGDLLSLLALSGFLITFFVPLFSVLAVWTGRELGQSWAAAFGTVDDAAGRTAPALWRFAETACYLAGILASLAGGILIMGNITGADAAHLGHAVGALLVAPTYGVLFGLVCRILRARVESRPKT